MRRGTLIALIVLFVLLSIAAFAQWELGQHPKPRPSPTANAP
jgi:hypothetical protein